MARKRPRIKPFHESCIVIMGYPQRESKNTRPKNREADRQEGSFKLECISVKTQSECTLHIGFIAYCHNSE